MFENSSLIREDNEFRASIEVMRNEFGSPAPLPIVVGGLSGGATHAYLFEAVGEAISIMRSRGASAPVLVLVAGDEAREDILSLFLAANVRAVAYKLREPVLYNISASHEIDRERLSVLSGILSGEYDVIVSTLPAALSLSMPKKRLEASSLKLKLGDEISPDALVGKLVKMGHAAVEQVDGVGQFSRRGGIVDFWGAGYEMPIRVEFFGDEIDRMVYFDAISQRAESGVGEISLLPAREMIADDAARERILARIRRAKSRRDLTEEMCQKLSLEEKEVEAGVGMNFIDKYMADVYETQECLFDYIHDGGKSVIFVMDTNSVRESAEVRIKKLEESVVALQSYGALWDGEHIYTKNIDDYAEYLAGNVAVHMNSLAGGLGTAKLAGLFGFRCRRTVAYGDNARMLHEDIIALRRSMYKIILLAESKEGADSLIESLALADISAVPIYDAKKIDLSAHPGGRVIVAIGSGEGYELITPKIALLSMSRDKGRAVMANRRKQRIMRRLGSSVKRLMSHADLTIGDYVVHASYGIGRFDGIEAVTVDGVTKDYITISYAGTDKLFVPCDKLENISKYIGERDGDGSVKLSKMGGAEWARTKTRAKASAESIAKNLIQLYAERQRLEGYAFPKNTEMEEEFDLQFEYEETDSQLAAIAEIRADMERPTPMNRLLCGDVGFGKTEVALRAAFKAILAGKQVAFLVPTTILAMQHYGTALARMRGYAVNIEMLSRFKKPRERKKILERTERGEVDLLIGTHSLLSKNIKFRDLGLLIVDEEQRFGVMQKEKLRELCKNVDTLMLSATPIPRTLNMAMSGINDISILDEAPGERHPVQTYVLEHDDGMIADALRREIARGGQVLYLYNKIEDIDFIASKLATQIPEARIAYAHGQMEREELEDIWSELVDGEIDILVSTTIIETGVDLPNANTLVIENADKFGLSQLHQIRGRVGRSERQAYAYFTYRPGKALSEIAEKRLASLREFAEFGAGFKIALRDLEIRGAGNLLGREQHGYIESVGYDLYIRLLNEAVIEERGGTVPEEKDAKIIISRSAHIPETYIKTPQGRMEMYKKISYISTTEERDEVLDEFIDRFGDIPKVTERLLNVSLARSLAIRAGVSKVEEKGGRITFFQDALNLDAWSVAFAEFPGLSFLGVGSTHVVYRLKSDEDSAAMAAEILAVYTANM